MWRAFLGKKLGNFACFLVVQVLGLGSVHVVGNAVFFSVRARPCPALPSPYCRSGLG